MRKIFIPGIVAGISMLVVNMAVGRLFQLAFPSIGTEFQNTNMFRPWTDPLMSVFFLHPFLTAFVLAWIWGAIMVPMPENGRKFGWASFGLAYSFISILGMFATYTSFTISLVMVLSWTIGSIIQGFVAAYIFSKMVK